MYKSSDLFLERMDVSIFACRDKNHIFRDVLWNRYQIRLVHCDNVRDVPFLEQLCQAAVGP